MNAKAEKLNIDRQAGPEASLSQQYSTFFIANQLYGIDVVKVQEVVKPMPMTKVPLAPAFIVGLINLRGQVATAVGMRELLGLPSVPPEHLMNVVCRIEGTLLALLVDEIGDVIEVQKEHFEPTPVTVSPHIKKFMAGVFKTPDHLLSVIDMGPIATHMGLLVSNSIGK